jgi:hypothetical protein
MYHDDPDDTQLHGFFLARLRRFARLANHPDVAAAPRLARLARQAALSAYRDCVSLGIEGEARALLARQDGVGAGRGG